MLLECEDLVRHMLVVDPERRLSVDQILNHKWMKMEGSDSEFERVIEEYNRVEEFDSMTDLNEQVLLHMENLGINRERTEQVSGSSLMRTC